MQPTWAFNQRISTGDCNHDLAQKQKYTKDQIFMEQRYAEDFQFSKKEKYMRLLKERLGGICIFFLCSAGTSSQVYPGHLLSEELCFLIPQTAPHQEPSFINSR